MEIIPAILEKEWSEIERKIELVRPFAKTIHLDIADGKMVPNTTFLDPKPFAAYTKDIFFELHMMVENPQAYLKPWAAVGIQRFIGHVEKMPDQIAFVSEGEQLGEVGLAIDGPTPIDAINVPYQDLDVILVMTIKAGFSGQEFMPEHLQKVQKIKKRFPALPIEVDGGINKETIKLAKEWGVNRCTASSFLFKLGDPKIQYSLLQSAITSLK